MVEILKEAKWVFSKIFQIFKDFSVSIKFLQLISKSLLIANKWEREREREKEKEKEREEENVWERTKKNFCIKIDESKISLIIS